jgi:hypothetical protein
MVRSGNEDKFLQNVRVFSVVFNAQELGIRAHRAVKLATGGGSLSYHFDEFRPLDRYTKDQACSLIRTILTEYSVKELHPIPKSAFSEIIRRSTDCKQA